MHNTEATLKRLDKLAALLDARWKIPGTDIRFGLDSLIGLIPGIGDAATALISVYLMGEAKAAGASNKLLGKMAVNVGVEFLVGLVPVIGDLFDIGWRANQRNMTMLRNEIAPPPEPERNPDQGQTSAKGWLILLALMAATGIASHHYGWFQL